MKTKILSILITVLSLCMCMFSLTACGGNNDNGNSYDPPHTHEYETIKSNQISHWIECSCGDKDGLEEHHGGNATCTEKAVCTDCGIEYGSKKSHSYTILKQSATQHWYECTCGAYETKENHIPGAEATETTDQKCTECGYVITSALGHVHTLHLTKVDAKPQSCTKEGNIEYYTCSCGKWFTDNTATTEITDKSSVVIAKDDHKYETLKKTATEHWWECSCGDKDGLEEHHGGNATCTQKAICTDCGLEYGSLEKHNYTELKKSSTQHWWECSCGAYETKENHKGGTATCQVKATCSICDTVYGNFAEHEPKTAWVITDTHHYHECVYNCGEKLSYKEHIFTDYVSNKDATYEKDGTKTAQCDGGCGKTHTVTDVGSMLIKDEIRFTTLTVDGKNVYGKVSNATAEFVFYEEILVSGNATYVVDNDKDCSSPIDSKTVDLVVGDNTFYVLEKVGNNVKLYTVTIHRREMFTVTFNTNGGTAVDCQIVEEDSFATEPTTSKTGYTFDGWDYDFNTAITSDTTINASWDAIEYDITYNLNGGTLSTSKNKYTIEQSITFDNPTRDYYTFSGWYNNADFNGSKITKLMIGTYGDIEFYAKWTPINYTIDYELNGGQNNEDNPTAYNVETETIILQNPTKVGYTFDGWYLESTFSTKVEMIEKGSHENIKFYAKWVINQYTLTIVYNNGQENLILTQEYNTAIRSVSNPTKTGYSFTGWDKTIPSKMPAYDVTVNATWKINQYTITIVYNNGQENLVIKQDYNTDIEAIENPEKTGYTFAGWDKTIPSKMPAENIKITASWDAIEYDIVYNLNNGKLTTDKNKYTIEQAVTFDNPIRDGYTFSGWYDNAAFNGSEIKGIAVGTYGKVKIYAKWMAIFTLSDSQITGLTEHGKTLTEIFLPEKIDETRIMSIGSSAFYSCSSLISVEIPNSVTSIGRYAFYGCRSLTSIEIPESVTSIGSDAFEYCSSLTSVVIPNSVTSIGSSAFENCDSLASVVIGDSVTSIGNSAFYNCSGLTRVNYTGTIDQWVQIEFDNGYSNPTCYAEDLYINNALVTEVNISSAEKISGYAFYKCKSTTKVTIGNSVTSIGSSAFYNCSGLTRVNYTGTIDQWVQIEFVSNASNPLYNNANLYINDVLQTEITINAEKINPYAFYNCYSIAGIIISEGVTSIGKCAFSGCSNVTEIYFNATDCSGFNNESYVFYGVGSSSKGVTLTFGENVISVPENMFFHKSFYGEADIVTIVFEENSRCEKIGEFAFCNLTSLVSLKLPETLTGIYSQAFYQCRSLKSITLNKNISWIGHMAFDNCDSLTKVNYTGTIDSWVEIEGLSNIMSSSTTLYINNEMPTEIVLTTATQITDYAFVNCNSITSVTIGNSVTSIGEDAFYSCSSLTNVTIGDGVTSIGYKAFYNCSTLKTVYYSGTAEDWDKISISISNSSLTSATRYYYIENESDLPTDDGNYWHYVDGIPTVWAKD